MVERGSALEGRGTENFWGAEFAEPSPNLSREITGEGPDSSLFLGRGTIDFYLPSPLGAEFAEPSPNLSRKITGEGPDPSLFLGRGTIDFYLPTPWGAEFAEPSP